MEDSYLRWKFKGTLGGVWELDSIELKNSPGNSNSLKFCQAHKKTKQFRVLKYDHVPLLHHERKQLRSKCNLCISRNTQNENIQKNSTNYLNLNFSSKLVET